MKNLPQNESAEIAAISILAQCEDAMTTYAWTDDLFLNFACKSIFNVILDLRKSGHATSRAAIAAKAEGNGLLPKIGGQHGLETILTSYPMPFQGSASHADVFHRELVDAASRRNVLVKSEQMSDDLRSGDVSAEEFCAAISDAATISQARKIQTLNEQLAELIDEIENDKHTECFKFGIQCIDHHLYGGFQRGELVTIAGPTAGGKSLMLAQATLESLKEGKSVVFYSLEMPAKAVLRRIVSNAANVSLPKPHERISGFQWDQVRGAFATVQKYNLTIMDSISSLADIETDANRLVKLGKADLIVVDYIQRVKNSLKNSNREQVIADISSRLKSLALQTGSAVLTASQLNKQGDVRESAAIEQDSDILIKIGEDSMVCAKFRRGASNWEANVTMRGDLGRFDQTPE